MIRLVLFITIISFVAWGGVWVADNPGAVSLNWGGWKIDTSASVLVFVAVVFAAAVALVYRVWLFITRAPAIVGGAMKQRRSAKGYRALTQGMVAVAAGDGVEAAKQVKRADGLLGDAALTLLLKAQAAQLNGDEKAAEEFFKAMLKNEETEFLGLRGLLGQAMKTGDNEAALELAHRAREIKPKSEWLADILFELESSTGHWELASLSLKQLEKISNKSGTGSGAEQNHRRGVVYFGRSMEAEKNGDTGARKKWAEKAFAADPSLVPAAIRLANIYAAENRPRKTMRLVENVWAQNPNPQLLEPYYLASGAVDGIKKVKAAEKLAQTNPEHLESFIALAQAALEAKLWGQARANLDRAMASGMATKRVFIMQAAIDEQENSINADSQSAKRWLHLAASSPPDPAWVCNDCGHMGGEWQPYCPSCAGFDSARWRSPQADAPLVIAPTARQDMPTTLVTK